MSTWLFCALCLLAGSWIAWRLHLAAQVINEAERHALPASPTRPETDPKDPA